MIAYWGTFIVVIISLHTAASQLLSSGKCANVTPVHYVNVRQYLGSFYEYGSIEGTFRLENPECVIISFGYPMGSADSNGFYKYSFRRASFFKDDSVRELRSHIFAKPVVPGVAGKLSIKLREFYDGPADATIIAANDAFIIVYICKQLDKSMYYDLVVFTREPVPSKNDIERIKLIIKQNNLDSTKLKVNTKSCKFPEEY